MTNFKIIEQALVDDEQWYTVQVHPKIGSWIRSQPKSMLYEHIDARLSNIFDMHVKIYTMLILHFSHESFE
jgi:hypothetical protein